MVCVSYHLLNRVSSNYSDIARVIFIYIVRKFGQESFKTVVTHEQQTFNSHESIT